MTPGLPPAPHGLTGEDLELFAQGVRRATGHPTAPEVDRALEALGWLDALGADPRSAVSLLFEHLGWANTTCSALDLLLINDLGTPHTASAIVLPALGSSEAPGVIADGSLTVRGLGSAGVGTHGSILVPSTDAADAAGTAGSAGTTGSDGPEGPEGRPVDGGHVVVEVPTDRLELRPIQGIDPGMGLVEVCGDGIAVDVAPAPAPAPAPVEGWSAAVATGRLAISHELVGASRAMLELASSHALERVQFGRPISSFQAVRHRLADTLVAVEVAEAGLDAAWIDRSHQSAAIAKALAGRSARTAARHCQQVLAGIGFTTEHPLHRYVRRVLLLDEMFGASRSLTRDLGEDVLTNGRLPGLLPL